MTTESKKYASGKHKAVATACCYEKISIKIRLMQIVIILL